MGRKKFLYEYTAIYNDGRQDKIKSTFKIGDVVRLTSSGGSYEYYESAFRYFGVDLFAAKMGQHCVLKVPHDYMKYNWQVIGLALHTNGSDYIIGLLKNHKNQFIVYGLDKYYGEGCGVTISYKASNHFKKKFEEKNKNYIIKQIP